MTTEKPTALFVDPRDPESVAALDAALKVLREAILASDETQVEIVPPRPERFGRRKIVGQAQFWLHTHPRE